MSIRLTLSTLLLTFASPALSTDKENPAAPAGGKIAPSTPTKPRDASTAMTEFKSDIAAIRALGIKLSEEGKCNPVAGMRMMKLTTAKLAAVRTDGLPEDLRNAYDRMARFWTATGEVYSDMPEEDAAVEAWARKKFSDPKFAEKFKPIMEEGRAAGAELTRVTKKYNIELELPGK